MNQPTTLPRQADYGLDAPRDLRRNALYGIGGVLMGGLLLFAAGDATIGLLLGTLSLLSGILLVAMCVTMVWGSKVGKLRLRDEVLNQITWRGDERALDVGCGHGLMMIGMAKRLTTGKAVGVDLWVNIDQANNSADAARANAALEGVGDRVAVRDGDARDLPFEPDQFDVVVTSWMLHFMSDPDDRTRSLREIGRVLKPGGRAVVIDTEYTRQYQRYFEENGWEQVSRSKAYYLFFTRTYVVTAFKASK
jgi:arsenite methyltransferase